jgi:hypothetical protein
MPTDFGEIASYHRREAAKHEKLAQEARMWGRLADAEYQTQLAATYLQAANEQAKAVEREAIQPAANQPPNRRPMERRIPFAAVCVLAVLSGAKRIASAFKSSKNSSPASVAEQPEHKRVSDWSAHPSKLNLRGLH